MKTSIARVLIALLLGFLILISFSGCISIYDPPRKGKVIDADTKEPIEGAVVLGDWEIFYLHYWLFPGGPTAYYDARETVTDENGHFTLPGLGPWLYPGYLQTPQITVTKKGYKHSTFSGANKKELEQTYIPYKDGKKPEWVNNRRIVPLRKIEEGGS